MPSARVRMSLGLTMFAFGLIVVQSTSAEAGGIFRRMFGRCQTPQYYAAPAPQAAPQSAPGGYQSFSYEPGTGNPAPVYVAPAAPARSSSNSFYDSLRGDRKALGKY